MTADVRDRLRQLTEAREKATGGPWSVAKSGGIDAGEYDTVIGRGPVDCMSYCYGGSSTIEGDNLPADAAAIVAEHNAVPWLVAALIAVLDLADELESYTIDRHPAPGSYDAGVIAMQVNAADRIRAVVAAAGDQP